MKKRIKAGLILAAMVTSTSQAAIVKVDMVGTISFGATSIFTDFLQNTHSSITSLTGSQAHYSFLFDTTVVPDDYMGSNAFRNAVSSFSISVPGNTLTSFQDPLAYTEGYNVGLVGGDPNTPIVGPNSYSISYAMFSGFGSGLINGQDYISALLSANNPISFYFYKTVLSSNDGNIYFGNMIQAEGNFNSITVSPATVPVPAAVWLFGSGLMGLFGTRRKSKRTQ